MKIELTRNEYRVLLTALDRMDDDHHNCQGNFGMKENGEETDIVFIPGVVACCFEGHLLVAAAQVLGLTPPPFQNEESWEAIWFFQDRVDKTPMLISLGHKLTEFAHTKLPVTSQQMDEMVGDTAAGALTIANDVYGTAAVRDAVRRGIAKGEIVVAAA